MQKNNLQDIFLTKVRKQSLPVTVFLMNGFQMRGSVTGFDSFTVVLDTDGRQQVIYKHAISTRLSRCTRWPCTTHACRRRRRPDRRRGTWAPPYEMNGFPGIACRGRVLPCPGAPARWAGQSPRPYADITNPRPCKIL